MPGSLDADLWGPLLVQKQASTVHAVGHAQCMLQDMLATHRMVPAMEGPSADDSCKSIWWGQGNVGLRRQEG